jgi:hypothetical protein
LAQPISDCTAASASEMSNSWRDLVAQYLDPILQISRGLGDEVKEAFDFFSLFE